LSYQIWTFQVILQMWLFIMSEEQNDKACLHRPCLLWNKLKILYQTDLHFVPFDLTLPPDPLITVMIHFMNERPHSNVFLSISASIPINAPIPISTFILISPPVLIEYYGAVRIRVNGGSSSSIAHIRNAALQKQWSSSEFLNFNVHACA